MISLQPSRRRASRRKLRPCDRSSGPASSPPTSRFSAVPSSSIPYRIVARSAHRHTRQRQNMQIPDPTDTALLVGPDEVPPVLEHNASGASPFLLACDHYGRLLPSALGDLGLSEDDLTRHIAWDIGIAGVAEQVAHALDAHLVAQRYSRLVIDCNRPPGVPNSIPIISERTTIPGNAGLTPQAAAAR